jgi:hypothetical protein
LLLLAFRFPLSALLLALLPTPIVLNNEYTGPFQSPFNRSPCVYIFMQTIQR